MAKQSELAIYLDDESKAFVTQAARLRKVSVGDYVCMIAVGQARLEVERAEQNTIALSPTEQLAFWDALNAPTRLSTSQRELGRMMRGEK